MSKVKRISNTIIQKSSKETYTYDCASFFCDVFYIAYCSYVNRKSEFTQPVLHSHPNYELHLPLSGYCDFELNDKTVLRIKANQFIVFPPNYNHRIIRESSDFSKFSCQFYFTPKENTFYKTAEILFKTPEKQEASDLMETYTDVIINYNNVRSGDFKNSIILSFMSFFIETCCTVVGDKHIYLNDHPLDVRTGEAVKFIDENMSANLTVDDVANHIHISKKQLERMFMNFLDITPGTYIKKHRAKKIRELLLNPDYSIEDIAEIMEYNSVSSMIKSFKRIEGITPHLFRQSSFYINKPLKHFNAQSGRTPCSENQNG